VEKYKIFVGYRNFIEYDTEFYIGESFFFYCKEKEKYTIEEYVQRNIFYITLPYTSLYFSF